MTLSTPACRLPSAETNLIVATHTCNFIIYGGSRVLWLAKGPTVPVAIAVAAVGKLEAAIVVLDDEGLLSICYLGTAPPSSVLGLSEGREPDWEMIQKRRRELMRIIRDKAPSTSGAARDADPGPPRYEVALHSQVLSPARNARRLDDIMHWRTESMEGRDTIFANLEVQVPQVLTASEEFGDEAVEEREDRRCDVRVYVRNTGSHDVTGVGLKVQAAWPVVAQECAHAISHLPAGRGTPHMVSLRFSYAAEAVPSSREVRVPTVSPAPPAPHCLTVQPPCGAHGLACTMLCGPGTRNIGSRLLGFSEAGTWGLPRGWHRLAAYQWP